MSTREPRATPSPATTDWVPMWTQQPVDLSTYQTRSEKNVPSGYVGLDGSSKIVLGGDTFVYRAAAGALAVANAAGLPLSQSGAPLTLRFQRSALEFGHSNPSGYGSNLGSNYGDGSPWLMFFGEAGTASNTIRTRGFPAWGITAPAGSNGLYIVTAQAANADNQGQTTVAYFVNPAADGESGLYLNFAGVGFLPVKRRSDGILFA